jgi:hypothetical protein
MYRWVGSARASRIVDRARGANASASDNRILAEVADRFATGNVGRWRFVVVLPHPSAMIGTNAMPSPHNPFISIGR